MIRKCYYCVNEDIRHIQGILVAYLGNISELLSCQRVHFIDVSKEFDEESKSKFRGCSEYVGHIGEQTEEVEVFDVKQNESNKVKST